MDQLDIKPGGLEDVYDFLRVHYLDPYSEDERGRFIRLCALAQFDIEVSAKALSRSSGPIFQEKGRDKSGRAVAHLLARGIVFERDMETYGFRYGLVHSSFARLILNATRGGAPNIIETIKECVKEDPHLGAPLLRGLTQDDHYRETLKKLGCWLVTERDILASVLFQTPAQFWYSTVRLLPDCPKQGSQDTVPAWQCALEIVCDHQYRSARESWVRSNQLHFLGHWLHQFRSQPGPSSLIDAAGSIILKYLVSDEKAFTDQVHSSPFHLLATFLQHLDHRPDTDTDSQEAGIAVRRILAKTEETDLAAKVHRAALGNITAFLKYLNGSKDPDSQAFTTAVRHILAKSDLTTQVFRAPFNFLATFLQYLDHRSTSNADDTDSQTIANAVRGILATSDLKAQVLRAPFNYLATFLQYLDHRSTSNADDTDSQTIATAVRGILAKLDKADLTAKVIRAQLGDIAVFLKYLDDSKDLGSQTVANAVRGILATSDLKAQVLRAPFNYLATFLQYLDHRSTSNADDTDSQTIATAVRGILAKLDKADLTTKVLCAPLDHLMASIEYFDERPSDERQSHEIADTIRDVLTKDRLKEKVIGAEFSELSGMLNSVGLSSPARPGDPAVSSLHERVAAVLRSSAMREKVISQLMHGASLSHLRDLLVAVKAFDSTAWETILSHIATSVGVGALSRRLIPPCSLKDATIFLGVFEGYDENRLLKQLNQFLLAGPEELAERCLREGLKSATHLLFRVRHNEVGEVIGFIKALSKTAISKTFYGPGGAGPAALFLWNAWRFLGASPEYNGLWDGKLVKIGDYGLRNWNANPDPELLLGRTLQLWGMIMRFSCGVPRSYPSRLPAARLPDQEMCGAVLSLQEFHDFAATTMFVLGLEALCLPISAEPARIAKECLMEAQTAVENPNLFIDQLVDQAILWLIKHGG